MRNLSDGANLLLNGWFQGVEEPGVGAGADVVVDSGAGAGAGAGAGSGQEQKQEQEQKPKVAWSFSRFLHRRS